MEVKEKKQRDALYITIIILLLGAGGFFFWQMMDYKHYKADFESCANDNVTLQKDIQEYTKMLAEAGFGNANNLKEELATLLQDYEGLQTNNDTLNEQIREKMALIEELQAKVENNKYDKYAIIKLQKEAGTLRSIMQGYVRSIDSLNTLNEKLIGEIKVKDETISNVTKEKDEISSEKDKLQDKVTKGAKLQTSSLYAKAIRVRDSGKQTDTERAGRADMVKACMTILENPMTKPGTKNVYMVVMKPDATILGGSAGSTFDAGGTNSQFSLAREIDYQNQTMDLCMYADVTDDLAKGTYIVQIYCEKMLIGKTTFTLK
jgi:myosin heavy subunit